MRTEFFPISRRGVELRYVTSHFTDMQGLRLAPLWGLLWVLAAVSTSIPNLLWWQRAVVAFTILLLLYGWLRWIRRWYEQRYGIVKCREPLVSSGILSITHPEANPPRTANDTRFPAVYLLLFALYMAPLLFSRRGTLIGGQFALTLLAFVVVPRCFYSALGNPLIRLRRVLSAAGSIFICCMYLRYSFAGLGKWPYLAAVFATLMVLDLYDHWLFTRLISGESAEASYE